MSTEPRLGPTPTARRSKKDVDRREDETSEGCDHATLIRRVMMIIDKEFEVSTEERRTAAGTANDGAEKLVLFRPRAERDQTMLSAFKAGEAL